MAYEGFQIAIPLGQLGLLTDDAASVIPINSLARADNIVFESGRISKSLGCTKFNATSLDSSAVVALLDYFPTPSTQRLIALTSNGKMWRDTRDGTFITTTAIKTGLGTLTTDSHLM